jgi:hypothetical protein
MAKSTLTQNFFMHEETFGHKQHPSTQPLTVELMMAKRAAAGITGTPSNNLERSVTVLEAIRTYERGQGDSIFNIMGTNHGDKDGKPVIMRTIALHGKREDVIETLASILTQRPDVAELFLEAIDLVNANAIVQARENLK